MVSREKKRKSCPKRVNRQWRCTFRSVEGMCIKKGNTVPLRQEQCIRSHRRNCLFPKPGLLQHFGAGAVQPRYGEDSIGRSRCLAPAELPCRRAQSRGAPGKRPMLLANMKEPLLHVIPHGLAGLARGTGRSCGSGLVLACGPACYAHDIRLLPEAAMRHGEASDDRSRKTVRREVVDAMHCRWPCSWFLYDAAAPIAPAAAFPEPSPAIRIS